MQRLATPEVTVRLYYLFWVGAEKAEANIAGHPGRV